MRSAAPVFDARQTVWFEYGSRMAGVWHLYIQ